MLLIGKFYFVWDPSVIEPGTVYILQCIGSSWTIGELMFDSRQGWDFSFFFKFSVQPLGSNQPSVEWVMQSLSPGLKWLGHESVYIRLVSKLRIRVGDPSHPCSSEIKDL